MVFVPARLGAGIGLILFGIFLGGVLVDYWNDGRRISIIAVLLTAAAPILGVLAIRRAFARGCSACKKELTSRPYAYPGTMFAFLSEQLRQGGAALEMFRRAPVGSGGHLAVLTLEVCGGCERMGAGKLEELRRDTEASPQVVSTTGERWLRPDELWLIGALRESRPVDV
jgi:hypothetical protein